MAELSLHNIDQITSDVKTEEIGFSHLFHDLVDHICCDVESRMQQGMSFEDAYSRVRNDIGHRGLKQIQEDTLYMVDSKYRNMKKLMKVSSVTGTVLLGFSAIFKIAHLPLAGIMLSLGAAVLAFLFLPSALIVLWKETKSSKKIVLFVSAFVTGFTFIFGMLFKIQHWPGSGFLVSTGMIAGMFFLSPAILYQLFIDEKKKYKRPIYIAGSISLITYGAGFWFKIMHWPSAGILILSGSALLMLVVFPLFTWVQWKNETVVSARFIVVVISFALFILPGALVNLNLQNNYEDGFRTTLQKETALIDLQRENNDRFIKLHSDSGRFPEMNTIHIAANEIINLIDLIELKMVEIAETRHNSNSRIDLVVDGQQLDYQMLKNPFDTSPAAMMMLPGCQPRQLLEEKISSYNAILIKYLGESWAANQTIVSSVGQYLPHGNDKGNQLALLPKISGLSMLASGILLTESSALRELASR